MKIVATSDTHFPYDVSKGLIPDGDVLIHAGDMMYTGYPDEWYPRLDSFSQLPHKLKLYVPGNHDFHPQNYRGIAYAELRKRAGITLIDGHDPVRVLPNGWTVMGIPYVTGLTGWAYAADEEWLENWLNEWESVKPDIVVSHAPPWRILDAIHPDKPEMQQQRCGSWALRRWFDKMERKPRLWFMGHIHESYGHQVVDGCHFYNVAMCDRNYEQANPAAVVTI